MRGNLHGHPGALSGRAFKSDGSLQVGDALADAETISVLRSALLPRTTVLTPNSLEARRLAGAAPDADLAACARELLSFGCQYVLVTGTHEKAAEVVNTLYDVRGVVREDRWPRLPGSYHGSGCTLASAIAALLARGLAPESAVRQFLPVHFLQLQ